MAKVEAVRVLFVTSLWPDVDRPWHGTFVKTQADSLREAGIDVDVLPIRGWQGPGEYVKACAHAARLNADSAYDVVHAHYGHGGVVGRLSLRTPLVLSYTGSDLNGKPVSDTKTTRRSRAEAWVFRRLAYLAATTITKSREMEALLPARCRSRNHVIPNGVDLQRFRRIPKEEARARLGWPREERSVLCVGDPAKPWKGLELAEHAAAALRARVPDARLRVAWQVAPEEIPVWMSAADALILPSRAEGSPNVIKEAMAMELPIVATPVGDVPERLDGIPGCFVRPGDPEQMGEALTLAVEHGPVPEAREAAADLSLERVAQRVIDVYRVVLARRRG